MTRFRWWVLCVVLPSCTVEQNISDEDLASISCGSDAECPGFGICDLELARCIATAGTNLVVLLSPARQGSIYSSSVALEWAASDADLRLLVAHDPDLSDPVEGFPRPVEGNTADFTPPEDGTYYWTVEANGRRNAVRSFARIFDAIHVYCANDPCPSSGSGLAESPFVSLRSALALAQEFGISRINVAGRDAGLPYVEALLLPPGITVEGGYSPDFSERDTSSYETVLGPEFAAPLRFEEADGARVSGFRLDVADGISTAIKIADSSNVHLEDLIVSGRGAERVEVIRVDDSSVALERIELSVLATTESLVATGLYGRGSIIDVSDSLFEVRSEGGTRAYALFATNVSDVSWRNTTINATTDGLGGRITGFRVARSVIDLRGSEFIGAQDAIDLSDTGGVVRDNRIDIASARYMRGLNVNLNAASLLENFGIDIGTLRVENNLMRINSTATESPTFAYGIQLTHCRPAVDLLHNTVLVYGPAIDERAALYLRSSDDLSTLTHAVNNIFLSVGGNANAAVIQEGRHNDDPATLLNNVIISEDSPAYADEGVDDANRVDLDEAGINGTDGTLVPAAGCPDDCSPSRVAGNRVLTVSDWRTLFVDAEGADLRTALMPATGSAAEPLRTNGTLPPATCGVLDNPVDCELPNSDAIGTAFSTPRATGALQPTP